MAAVRLILLHADIFSANMGLLDLLIHGRVGGREEVIPSSTYFFAIIPTEESF